MRVIIARTMPEFSMDVYADHLIAELRAIHPDWDIIDLKPHPVDRKSRSVWVRAKKSYERFLGFPRVVQQQRADIVHIIDPAEAHMVYGLRRRQQAVVVTCHDLINLTGAYNLQASVQLPVVSRALWLRAIRGMQQANHICAVSQATANDTTRLLQIAPERITVTPNGVNTLFQPLPPEQVQSIRQQYGGEQSLCLLNVGSNHPRKNLSILLQVIAQLKQMGIPVQFWKVGADFTEAQVAFIQAHDLQSHVHYLGKPDPAGLLHIYNAADLLLAPSLDEGFGMTILEAMACGTPVITSNCSAMPEVAGDAGILVDPKDAEAIVQAVRHLYDHPDAYRVLVQRGLVRAKQFTWRQTAAQVAAVYEQVVQTAAGQPIHETIRV